MKTRPASLPFFLRCAAQVCAALLLLNPFARMSAAARLPTIYAFNVAAETTINLGTTSQLNWSVGDATQVSLSPGVGVVTGTSVNVTPTATTTYVLTATNAAGSVSKSKKITVIVPPVMQSLSASPTSIKAGAAATLSWSATGANYFLVVADNGDDLGNLTAKSMTVRPATTTTYTVTAVNTAGRDVKTITIPVTAPLPKPTLTSFTATPSTVTPGAPTTLGWTVNGATSLSISPGIGAVTGTSIVVNPTASTTYTLTATNASGSVTKKATVTVSTTMPPPVINSFTASPGTLTAGSSTLSWSVTGATELSISANVGASPGIVTGSSTSVSPTASTVYTLKATNSSGSVTRTTTVTVTGPATPTISSFAAQPIFIRAGEATTLSWSVSGADTLAITADVGQSPGAVTGTSVVVNPSATTNYTLTATNAIGHTTAVAPVTIFTGGGNGSVVHPRIWVTPTSAITLNARAAVNDPAWIRLRNDCDAYLNMTIRFPDQDGGNNTIDGGYQYNDYLKPSEELALGYVAAKTADPVRAARYAAKEKQLLLALADPVHHGRTTTDSGYSIRSYVPALALGYDWIFETLSDAERAQIYTEINRWVVSYEATGFGRDYPQGNYFAGYYCAKALAALATEGENPSAPAMWSDWLNRVHFGMAQPYHTQWLSGGGSPEGWNYGPFETLNMIRPVAAALTAKGLDLVHDAARPMVYFDGHARWMTQFTWPDMKTVSDRGFVYNSDNPTGTDASWATQFNGFLHLVNGDNAAIMQRYTLDLRAQQGTGEVEAWAEFLLHNNTAPVAEYRTDLSYKTNGDGQVAMRSSWANDAVWAAFQAGPYTGYPGSSEEFFDEGALTIQRGGIQFLVNTWGAMMRNTPGTTDGDPVFDDVFNELFSDQTDGVHAGRRLFNTYYAVRPDGYWGQGETTPFDHSTTTLSRFEEGGSYVLMRGTHLENQYFSDHPITGWTRTVAYVRPQLFVAYDRTTLRNASADNWMAWHVGPAPVARTDAAAGTHAFDVVDTRAAFGGNLFRGRVTTVLPAGNAVTPVNLFGRGKVFRLEVRNAAPSTAATWLTVFDASASAAEAKNAVPLTATVAGTIVAEGTLISGGSGTGVAVLFSKSGAPIAGALSFQVPMADTSCLLPDLAVNTGYSVTASVVNGRLNIIVATGGTLLSSASGTLAFNVSSSGAITAP